MKRLLPFMLAAAVLAAGCRAVEPAAPERPAAAATPAPPPAAEPPAPRPAQALADAELDRLLAGWRAAQGAVEALSARFRCVETSSLLAAPRVTAGTIQVRKPNRYRRTVLDEKTGEARGLMVLAPPDFWVYLPQLKEAEHCNLARLVRPAAENPLSALEDFVSLELGRLKARFDLAAFREPEGTVRLECSPRGGRPIAGVERLRLWMRPGAFFPEKIETTLAGGDSRVETFTEIKAEARLDDALFTFRPPRGVKMTEVAR